MDCNGLMIDCARLKEPHDYYFQLIDFMSLWDMNLLLLHFSDDHGLSIRLPGFEHLACPNAFDPGDVTRLIRYAAERGIEIVPELETFGHTRFITDHPDYAHLYACEKSEKIAFNAINPIDPATHELMKSLIDETAGLFPSGLFHVGCDEVDLSQFCAGRGLDERQVYSDYVNRIFAMVRRLGRTPLFWADHAVKSPEIAAALDKDAVAVHWSYGSNVTDDALASLKKHGFERILCAPSAACWEYRFLTPECGLRNIDLMAGYAVNHGLPGVINTVWCPYRYFQKSVSYGIAYCAEKINRGDSFDRTEFNAKFAERVFGTGLTPDLDRFLRGYPKLEITRDLAAKIDSSNACLSPEQSAKVQIISEIWLGIRDLARSYKPRLNGDVWESMKAAADAAGICSRWFVLEAKRPSAGEKAEFNSSLRAVRENAESLWNATRYPDDPQKHAPFFPNESSQYALVLLGRIPFFS